MGDVGIHILPFYPAENAAPLETLTDQTIQVSLTDGYIFYEGELFPIQCFNYDGRYFFKIADMANVSAQRCEAYITLTKGYADGGYTDKPPMDNFISIGTSWNAESGVIEVNKVSTDLWEVFRNEKPLQVTVNVDTTTPNQQIIREGTTPAPSIGIDNIIVKQPPLTKPPKVGTQLANILIDENAGAYLSNGEPNYDNIMPAYKEEVMVSVFGECTWYATGRFTEVTGIEAQKHYYWAGEHISWFDNIEKYNCGDIIVGTTDLDTIKAQSIAIWDGHVAFIEYVEYDTTNTPITVYFTEGNTGRDGVYRPTKDAVIQSKSFSSFVKSNGGLVGYIAAK